MAPPADQDIRLLTLQGKVSDARLKHEDLVGRERVLRNFKYTASANVLQAKVDEAFLEFQEAKRRLASYLSRKQRGFHG